MPKPLTSHPPSQPAVFISYSHSDKQLADRICELLESNGIKCWMAPRDVLAGQSYAQQIYASLDSAVAVLIILSHRSIHSPHVRREVERATTIDVPIVPIQIEQLQLPEALQYFLGDFHRLDASCGLTIAHFDELIRSISHIVSPDGRSGDVSTTQIPSSASVKFKARNRENRNAAIEFPYALRLLNEKGDDLIYKLASSRITIGRGIDCDIVLTDPTCSRCVCGLNWSPDKQTFSLIDFQAVNGVWLNAQKVAQPEPLDVGDIITIGNSRLSYERIDM